MLGVDAERHAIGARGDHVAALGHRVDRHAGLDLRGLREVPDERGVAVGPGQHGLRRGAGGSLARREVEQAGPRARVGGE